MSSTKSRPRERSGTAKKEETKGKPYEPVVKEEESGNSSSKSRKDFNFRTAPNIVSKEKQNNKSFTAPKATLATQPTQEMQPSQPKRVAKTVKSTQQVQNSFTDQPKKKVEKVENPLLSKKDIQTDFQLLAGMKEEDEQEDEDLGMEEFFGKYYEK